MEQQGGDVDADKGKINNWNRYDDMPLVLAISRSTSLFWIPLIGRESRGKQLPP